jgi:hypothetical protein
MGGLVLDLSGSEQQLVTRFCEHGNATSIYIHEMQGSSSAYDVPVGCSR